MKYYVKCLGSDWPIVTGLEWIGELRIIICLSAVFIVPRVALRTYTKWPV